MGNLTNALKNASKNGSVDLHTALRLAKQFEAQEETGLHLLRQCKTQVGMTLGGDIGEHIASLTGSYFNMKEFNYERMPGEQ